MMDDANKDGYLAASCSVDLMCLSISSYGQMHLRATCGFRYHGNSLRITADISRT